MFFPRVNLFNGPLLILMVKQIHADLCWYIPVIIFIWQHFQQPCTLHRSWFWMIKKPQPLFIKILHAAEVCFTCWLGAYHSNLIFVLQYETVFWFADFALAGTLCHVLNLWLYRKKFHLEHNIREVWRGVSWALCECFHYIPLLFYDIIIIPCITSNPG